jgi:hypothetical protein
MQCKLSTSLISAPAHHSYAEKPMQVIFSGQIPKDFNFPESTEDAFEIDVTSSRIALSDGASESFDSKTWAKLLVRSFVQNPEVNIDWLAEAVGNYNERHDPASLSWSKQAAFERGSYATLIGIECFRNHCSIDIIGIGDSLAVLLSGNDFLDSFPYKTANEFKQRPTLFCTNTHNNNFVDESDFYSLHSKTWSVGSIPSVFLLCMTDALAEWALMMAEVGKPQWRELMAIRQESELQVLVESEREKKLMRTDDVTLITVSFG